MKVSYHWLQDYIEDPLPSPREVTELLTMHAFEIESVTESADDTIFDVKVLPDRSHDCFSHRGIALEIALLAKLRMKKIAVHQKLSYSESNVLKVEYDGVDVCRRFSALVIENIEVKESPERLRNRLKAVGQRSINNIVDATNFVMLSLGQPLHAYDRDLLRDSCGGYKLVVRGAKKGESIQALDDKEYVLSEDDLVIALGDEQASAIGIAGIKGGKATEISKQTRNIVLEAANFDPIAIRKSAKRLGLRTDASIRFENGIAPELTLPALKAVSDLIFDIAGTSETQVEGMVDLYKRPAQAYQIGVALSDIQKVLGMDISKGDVEDIFTRSSMQFSYIENPRDYFMETAKDLLGSKYSFGASVLRDSPKEFDCSGLVAYCAMKAGFSLPRMSIDQYVFCREVGEEELKPGDLVFTQTPGKISHTESKEWMPGVKVPEGVDHVGIMVSQSENEVLHTSSLNPDGARIETLKDFLSIREFRGFRSIPGFDGEGRFIVTIPAERLDLRIKEDLIEEVGRIYGYENLTSKPLASFEGEIEIEKRSHFTALLKRLFVEEGFSEAYTYVFRNTGIREIENPLATDKKFLRSDLSSGLEEALAINVRNSDLLGLEEIRMFEIGKVFGDKGESLCLAFAIGNAKGTGDETAMHMTKKVEEILGVKVSFEKNASKKTSVYEAEIGQIIDALPSPTEIAHHRPFPVSFSYKSISPYPFILRDIAVFVPEGEDDTQIVEIVRQEAGELLARYRLFDRFTKEFPEGKKTSFAYRLVFQSFHKTLTDAEMNPVMERVTEALNAKEGWQVR